MSPKLRRTHDDEAALDVSNELSQEDKNGILAPLTGDEVVDDVVDDDDVDDDDGDDDEDEDEMIIIR